MTCLLSLPLNGTINSAYKYGRQWSTTITGDPDSHEDFRPANKLANSGSSVQEVVENDVKGNHIMIYMKGVPEAPRCGFSALAVRVLQEYVILSASYCRDLYLIA
ncbi:hypothetical protein AMTR_s00033p00147490 [Amborella trichopoda]|uniref:Glutaredoxin domain-containing protein n=1 Tax=Amborella trichopoda TaxID=13333 RepID=U5CM96_AMBTC|nr:hypothetical protein AMTR_s00033p00147490 [Amborella trichopoda]